MKSITFLKSQKKDRFEGQEASRIRNSTVNQAVQTVSPTKKGSTSLDPMQRGPEKVGIVSIHSMTTAAIVIAMETRDKVNCWNDQGGWTRTFQ